MIGMIPADISYATSYNGKNKIRTIFRKKHKMRSLIKWNPISDFHEVTNQLSHLMNFGQRPYYNDEGGVNGLAEWIPAVNVTEDDSGYHIDLEVPGVRKDDIQINLDNGIITVSGERKLNKRLKNDKIHKTEFGVGKFSRNFKIPQNTEFSKINASFENGILSVSLPKAESSKPKNIKIEVK